MSSRDRTAHGISHRNDQPGVRIHRVKVSMHIRDVTLCALPVRPEILGGLLADRSVSRRRSKLRFVPVTTAREVEVLVEEVNLSPNQEHLGVISKVPREPGGARLLRADDYEVWACH